MLLGLVLGQCWLLWIALSPRASMMIAVALNAIQRSHHWPSTKPSSTDPLQRMYWMHPRPIFHPGSGDSSRGTTKLIMCTGEYSPVEQVVAARESACAIERAALERSLAPIEQVSAEGSTNGAAFGATSNTKH